MSGIGQGILKAFFRFLERYRLRKGLKPLAGLYDYIFLDCPPSISLASEVELDDPEEQANIPDWIGREVTDDPCYYNSSLVVHPYSEWGVP